LRLAHKLDQNRVKQHRGNHIAARTLHLREALGAVDDVLAQPLHPPLARVAVLCVVSEQSTAVRIGHQARVKHEKTADSGFG
jgi:hypothetical protein